MTSCWFKMGFAGWDMKLKKEKIFYIAFLIIFLIILNFSNTTKAKEAKNTSIVESSESYDYVIITNNTLKSSFEELANWKTKKGVKAKVVTIENITNDSDYNGIDTQEEIRNFIIDAYNNWEITYVLLGGDTNIIPYRGVYGIVNKDKPKETEDFDIPCDMYYASLDGNWDNDGDGIYGEGSSTEGGSGTAGEEADLTAEVYVTRAPVDTIPEADNFVSKIISYEKNPVTDYLKNGLFIASKLDSNTDGAITSDNIINNKIPSDFTITKLYENDGSATNSNTTNQLNNGQHIVNIIGHGSPTLLELAHEDYTDSYTILDVDNLANGNRYFLIYSVGCDSNSFDVDSISEHFINNNGNGAFAYIGNSRYGWYTPGQPGKGASEKLNLEFFDEIYQENIFNLGKAFQYSKEDLIGDVEAIEAMRWCYFSLTLLGDPETPIWTSVPKQLEVSYKSKIFNVLQEFKVYVNDSSIPLENAVVCIRQNQGIYEVKNTNSMGIAKFDISPLTGLIEITVTKHNYLIYEGIIMVRELNPPKVEVLKPIAKEYHCNLSVDWNAWDNGSIEKIKIEYRYEDGEWKNLVENLSNFPSHYEWNLLEPYMPNGNYTIKVIAKDDEGNFGENVSEEFYINNPRIEITEPSSGEIVDGEKNIMWVVYDDYNVIEGFEIWISSDGGANYEILNSSISKSRRWWKWNTTNFLDGKNYKIKIIANIGTNKIENTTNNFTIYNPDPPIPVINVDKLIVWEDEKIIFNANSSSDPDENAKLEYYWDFEDGNQKKGKIVPHSFKKKGFYNVTLTVVDETFLENSTTVMIRVNNSPPIAILKVNKTDWNEDEEIFFDASSSIDNLSDKLTLQYYWEFGDGRFGYGEKIIHSYADKGNYTVTLTVTDDDYEENKTTIIITVINLKPIANAGSYQRANRHEIITFDGSGSWDTPSDKPNLQYFWDFGDGNEDSGINYIYPQHKYEIAKRYKVTLTVVDNNGAMDVSRIVVDINNITIKAKISKIGSMDIGIVDQYQEVVFDASNTTKPSDAIINYYWDFADECKGYGKIVRYKFNKGTKDSPYTVKLKIEDNDTADESDEDYEDYIEVWVNWAPVAKIAPLNKNLTVNEPIIFDASLSSDLNEYGLKGNIVEYIWDFGDGTIGKNVTAVHSYSNPGNYTVILTVKDERGVESREKIVVVVQEKGVEPRKISKSIFEEYLFFWILIIVLIAIIPIGIYYQKKKKVVFKRVEGMAERKI